MSSQLGPLGRFGNAAGTTDRKKQIVIPSREQYETARGMKFLWLRSPPVVFVLATEFLFTAVMGIMILWMLAVNRGFAHLRRLRVVHHSSWPL
jgi:hypothetical protein